MLEQPGPSSLLISWEHSKQIRAERKADRSAVPPALRVRVRAQEGGGGGQPLYTSPHRRGGKIDRRRTNGSPICQKSVAGTAWKRVVSLSKITGAGAEPPFPARVCHGRNAWPPPSLPGAR